MKREEKNQQTKRRIMDSALAEFSSKGYGASSVNAISAAQDVSKGIIYHYFETRRHLSRIFLPKKHLDGSVHIFHTSLPLSKNPYKILFSASLASPFSIRLWILGTITFLWATK